MLETVRVVSSVRGNSIIVRSLPVRPLLVLVIIMIDPKLTQSLIATQQSKLWTPAASRAGMRATVAGLGPDLAASVIFQ